MTFFNIDQNVKENVDFSNDEYAIEVVFKDGKKERFTNSDYEKVKWQYQMLSQKPEVAYLSLLNSEGEALASTDASSVARRNRRVAG